MTQAPMHSPEPPKPLRILVDAHVFDSEFQGSRTFIQGLYSALSVKGCEFILAAADVENLKQSFPDEPSFRFVTLPAENKYRRLLFGLPRLAKQWRADYVHFQYTSSPLMRNRQIVTVHDVLFCEFPEEFSWRYRFVNKFLFGISARRAAVVTTVSDYSKKAIHQYLHVPLEKIDVVPNGVAPVFFEPYDKAAAQTKIEQAFGIRNFILYVSRVEKRKNHLLLIQSFVALKLHERGYNLVMIGHWSDQPPELTAYLEQLSPAVRKKLHFFSGIPFVQLLDFYRATTLFIYPSKAEGFGIPPLEAAASKVPVICYNSSSMTDFDFFGDNHLDPSNPVLLAEAIDRNLTEPMQEEELERIATIVKGRFTWKAAAEKYEAILQRLQKDKRK